MVCVCVCVCVCNYVYSWLRGQKYAKFCSLERCLLVNFTCAVGTLESHRTGAPALEEDGRRVARQSLQGTVQFGGMAHLGHTYILWREQRHYGATFNIPTSTVVCLQWLTTPTK